VDRAIQRRISTSGDRDGEVLGSAQSVEGEQTDTGVLTAIDEAVVREAMREEAEMRLEQPIRGARLEVSSLLGDKREGRKLSRARTSGAPKMGTEAWRKKCGKFPYFTDEVSLTMDQQAHTQHTYMYLRNSILAHKHIHVPPEQHLSERKSRASYLLIASSHYTTISLSPYLLIALSPHLHPIIWRTRGSFF